MRHLPGFFAQIQLEVDLGQIQLAQSAMVCIAGRCTGAPRCKEHFDCATVFTAQVIQVGDIVVGLVAEQGHVVTHVEVTSRLIAIQCPGKVIQVDQTHGHVVQCEPRVFPLLIIRQALIRAFVISHGLLKTILAMKNVPHIVVETRDARSLAQPGKHFSSAFRSCKRTIVFTQEIEGLNRSTQRARSLFPKPQGFVEFQGSFVVLHGSSIVPGEVESVTLRAKRERQILFAAQAARDENRCLSEMKRLPSVNADFVNNQGSKPAYDLAADQGTVACQESPPSDVGINLRQLGNEFFF